MHKSPTSNALSGRSQWTRGLRRGSAAACLLRLWVRIPPGAWMSVSCWMLCVVRSLRCADHSSRGVLPSVVWRCMWSKNLAHEEALIHCGLLHQKMFLRKSDSIGWTNTLPFSICSQSCVPWLRLLVIGFWSRRAVFESSPVHKSEQWEQTGTSDWIMAMLLALLVPWQPGNLWLREVPFCRKTSVDWKGSKTGMNVR
jgi:hypothetical protein